MLLYFKKLLHEVKHLKHINNRLDKYICEKEVIVFEEGHGIVVEEVQ